MKHMNRREARRLAINVGIFAAIMALTFWSVFRGQDFVQIVSAIGQMSGGYMAGQLFWQSFLCRQRGV